MALPKRRSPKPRKSNLKPRKTRPKVPVSKEKKKARNELVEWVRSLKERKCPDCGYDGAKHPEAMDFDHVIGKKRFTISQFVRTAGHLDNARDLLEREIAKCEVVCSNCHRIRTLSRLKGKSRWIF